MLVIAGAASAWAQKRTDTVTLLNGDRLTGDVMSLERGRLEIKTDDAGTIDIEWDKVASVTAARGFETTTADGGRLLGSLSTDGGARALRVLTDEGAVSLAMADVTRLTPIGASFWRKLDGSIDAGFNYTQSSGIAQATLNTSTIFRKPASSFRLAASATVTAQDDEQGRDDRAAVELEHVRYRGRGWFMSAAARFDSNQSLGLELRSQLSGVVGQRVVNTNHGQLELGAGLVLNDERAVEAPPTQNVEGVLGLKTSYYRYDRPRTQLDFNFQYYPSLSNWGRNRLQLDSAAKREVWKDFFLALNLYDSFDSAPPQPGAARNDVGVSFSFGWSY